MPIRSFNLDDKSDMDLEKLRQKLKVKGRLPSASSVVRDAISCLLIVNTKRGKV